MKLCIIGTGYVGLVSGACFAEMGNDVICVDNDLSKLAQLEAGNVGIYEQGLEELVRNNVAEGRLRFSANLLEAVRHSTICFIAVGTPPDANGDADLTALFSVVETIALALERPMVLAIKSTVPVGTGARVEQLVASLSSVPVSVVSNPEFLKQGSAVEDCMKPDRIIVGTEDALAASLLQELYAPFMRTGNRLLLMDRLSAEMAKYAANAFLATKISFMNEMSQICEQVGANIDQVRYAMAGDARIGSQFLFAGLGYGGSCFPKDVRALMATARRMGAPHKILDAVDAQNIRQRLSFLQKIQSRFQQQLAGKTFAVWGLSFKPKTDDVREAPSLTLINALREGGAVIQAYDPKALEKARQELGDERIRYCGNRYETLEGADALVIMTEWHEFRRPDFARLRQSLNAPLIFDGRNLFSVELMAREGFEYHSVGRASSQPLRITVSEGLGEIAASSELVGTH